MIILLFVVLWENIKTDNFTIFYPSPSYKECALQEGAILEYYYPEITKFAHNTPERTVVFIEDIGGISNGFAMPLVNGIHLFSYIPYPQSEFGGMTSWWRVVGIHEFTHIANLTSVKGINLPFRYLLGKIFQPNSFLPRWIAESYAVYSESRQFPYEGRLNEGFLDAYMRVCAKEDRFPSLTDITYMPDIFPYYSIPYIWGGEMIKYRAEKYGDAFVSDWADNIAEVPPLFFLPAFELELTYWLSYSSGVNSSYMSLQRDLKKKFQDENFSQESRIIYSGNTSLAFLNYDEHYLYFLRHRIFDSGVYNTTDYDEIVRLNLENYHTKVMIRAPMLAPFPFRVRNGIIYYGRSDIRKGGNNISQMGFKIVNDIYAYNTHTGENKRIYSDDGTLKSFDIVDDGSMLIAKQSGWRGGSIERIKDGKSIPIFHSDKITPLDIVEDNGKIVSIMHNEDKGNSITISGGDKIKIEAPYAKNSLHLYGDTILFSSNRDGRWETYIWTDGRLIRITDLPFCSYPVMVNNKIYFIGLTSTGETVEETTMHFSKTIEKFKHLPASFLPPISGLRYTKTAGLDNFRHLLWDPVLRLPIPYFSFTNSSWNLFMLAFGMDASLSRKLLWSFNYSAGSGLTDYSINYFTSRLTPFYISLGFSKYKKYYKGFSYISYPLYNTTKDGLQGLYLSLDANQTKGPDTLIKQLNIYPTFRFGDYNKQFFITPLIKYNSSIMPNNIKLRRYYLFTDGNIDYPNFSMKFEGIGGYAENTSDSITLLPICGNVRRMKSGIKAGIELQYRLFSINNGLWFPSIYLNGLWFRTFGEMIYSQEWNKPVSTIGALLSLETSGFFYLHILPSIGISYRIDEGRAYLLWSIIGTINSKKISQKNIFHFPYRKDKKIFEISNYHIQSFP